MNYCKSLGQREGTLNSKSNKVDDTPFLEINILDLNDMQILELKKFSKDVFNIDTFLTCETECNKDDNIPQIVTT